MFMVIRSHRGDLPLRVAIEELDGFITEVRILGVCAAVSCGLRNQVTA
ncbi:MULTISPECIES: hypothetical protein [unclassified Arthrobacter]